MTHDRYHTTFGPDTTNHPHKYAIDMIGTGQSVLELGLLERPRQQGTRAGRQHRRRGRHRRRRTGGQSPHRTRPCGRPRRPAPQRDRARPLRRRHARRRAGAPATARRGAARSDRAPERRRPLRDLGSQRVPRRHPTPSAQRTLGLPGRRSPRPDPSPLVHAHRAARPARRGRPQSNPGRDRSPPDGHQPAPPRRRLPGRCPPLRRCRPRLGGLPVRGRGRPRTRRRRARHGGARTDRLRRRATGPRGTDWRPCRRRTRRFARPTSR